MSDVRKEEKSRVCEVDTADRVELALSLDHHREEALFLALLPEIFEGLKWCASPQGRSWLFQHVRALLIWTFWGFATCGIGWLVLLPSLCRWRKRARQAAREGQTIERW